MLGFPAPETIARAEAKGQDTGEDGIRGSPEQQQQQDILEVNPGLTADRVATARGKAMAAHQGWALRYSGPSLGAQ